MDSVYRCRYVQWRGHSFFSLPPYFPSPETTPYYSQSKSLRYAGRRRERTEERVDSATTDGTCFDSPIVVSDCVDSASDCSDCTTGSSDRVGSASGNVDSKLVGVGRMRPGFTTAACTSETLSAGCTISVGIGGGNSGDG